MQKVLAVVPVDNSKTVALLDIPVRVKSNATAFVGS